MTIYAATEMKPERLKPGMWVIERGLLYNSITRYAPRMIEKVLPFSLKLARENTYSKPEMIRMTSVAYYADSKEEAEKVCAISTAALKTAREAIDAARAEINAMVGK